MAGFPENAWKNKGGGKQKMCPGEIFKKMTYFREIIGRKKYFRENQYFRETSWYQQVQNTGVHNICTFIQRVLVCIPIYIYLLYTVYMYAYLFICISFIQVRIPYVHTYRVCLLTVMHKYIHECVCVCTLCMHACVRLSMCVFLCHLRE